MSCSSTLFQSRSKQFYHGKKTQRRRSSATTGTVLVIALFIAGLVAAIFPTIVFLQSLMSPSPDEDILVESMHGFSSSSLIENRFVEDVPMQNISSVDYMACCGAGHRISKTADANYLARVLNFTLRSFWGFCDTSVTDPSGSETEVFLYVLFTARSSS